MAVAETVAVAEGSIEFSASASATATATVSANYFITMEKIWWLKRNLKVQNF